MPIEYVGTNSEVPTGVIGYRACIYAARRLGPGDFQIKDTFQAEQTQGQPTQALCLSPPSQDV